MTVLVAHVAAMMSHSYSLNHGSHVICSSYTLARGDMFVCDVNGDDCGNKTTIYTFQDWGCKMLVVTGSNVTLSEDMQSISAFFKDYRNYLVSVLILTLNIFSLIVFGLYKLYQRQKKKAESEAGPTSYAWRKNEAGDYEPVDVKVANQDNELVREFSRKQRGLEGEDDVLMV